MKKYIIVAKADGKNLALCADLIDMVSEGNVAKELILHLSTTDMIEIYYPGTLEEFMAKLPR